MTNWQSKNHRWKEYDLSDKIGSVNYQLNKKNNMKKFAQIFKSRTFYTLVVLFIINGVSGIESSIPAGILPVVNGLLGILTIYFKISPSQEYN